MVHRQYVYFYSIYYQLKLCVWHFSFTYVRLSFILGLFYVTIHLSQATVESIMRDKMPKKGGRWWFSWRGRNSTIKEVSLRSKQSFLLFAVGGLGSAYSSLRTSLQRVTWCSVRLRVCTLNMVWGLVCFDFGKLWIRPYLKHLPEEFWLYFHYADLRQ